MNTDIQIVEKQEVLGRMVNVYGSFENPLFLAKDVAEWIEYRKTSNGIYDVFNLLKSVDEDEKLIRTLFVSGQNRNVWMLTENGLYEVLMQSRKPIAKGFKKGIKEMLKSIRKHGVYATPQKLREMLANPETVTLMLMQLQEEQQLRQNAEREVTRMKPKAELMDKVMDSGMKIDIGQAAKILALPFGRNTLFAKLREKGIFFKERNEPRQEYIKKGFFELKEKWIQRDHHQDFPIMKVLVTQRGLAFIAELFGVVSTAKGISDIQ